MSMSKSQEPVRIPWGKAVRIVLLARGMTVADLAEQLRQTGFKYTRNYVSSVVYGRVITQELHKKISDQLGIPDDDFIEVTGENYASFLS